MATITDLAYLRQFQQEFNQLYSAFQDSILLYGFNVNITNFSDLSKGKLYLLFTYPRKGKGWTTIEIEGKVNHKYRRALKQIRRVMINTLRQADGDDHAPFASLLM